MNEAHPFGTLPDAAHPAVAPFVLRMAGAIALVTLWISPVAAQKSAGPVNGSLIVDGGGATQPVVRRFVELAGGAEARIIVIPTAPSAIRFGNDNVNAPDGLVI